MNLEELIQKIETILPDYEWTVSQKVRHNGYYASLAPKNFISVIGAKNDKIKIGTGKTPAQALFKAAIQIAELV